MINWLKMNINKLRKFKFRKHEGLITRREETIARWKRLGLLDGLYGKINGNTLKFIESALTYSIK